MTYWKSVILVLLGACSYGVLPIFVKFAYDRGFNVNQVSGVQIFFGFCMLWLFQLIRHGMPKAKKGQWGSLLAVGLTMGLTSVFYYYSLLYVSASLAIVLLFQFTWIGILLEALAERRFPSGDKIIAVLILLVGTLLAANLSDVHSIKFSLPGWISGGLSAITYALFIFFSGKIATELNSLLRTSIILTGGMIVVFAVFPPHFFYDGSLWNELWMWGLLLALFGAVIPTLFFAMGVPRIGSGTATILGAAELPTAILMSSLVLKEGVTLLQWVGVIFILIGIALPEWVQWRRLKKGM
jgi:drug/metabolite transporter (DMT)-like permease